MKKYQSIVGSYVGTIQASDSFLHIEKNIKDTHIKTYNNGFNEQ